MSESGNISAIEVTAYSGHAVTNDGQHTLFRFETGDVPVMIAFPKEHLPHLLQSAVMALSQGQQQPVMQSGYQEVFDTDWWEVARTQDGRVIISHRIRETGGMLRFALTADMIPGLHETLGVLLGTAQVERPPQVS